MWNKVKTEFDKNENKYGKRANFALIIGVLSLVFAPILLTQFSWRFDFTETGQIGDTIGGTASPILSFIGAILVYFSFKQQMAANRIQINALLDEKQSKNDMQIVDFCDKIQREIIEKISTQEVVEYTIYSENGFPVEIIDEKKGEKAISSTLRELGFISNNVKLREEYLSCFSSIIIIFRNVKLLLTYISKIENETVQEMLFNSYYNNLHLALFIGATDIYLKKKSHSVKDRRFVKLCISIYSMFTELDMKYKVQNKWLMNPQN